MWHDIISSVQSRWLAIGIGYGDYPIQWALLRVTAALSKAENGQRQLLFVKQLLIELP